MSHSRSNIKVGFIFWLYYLLFSVVLGIILYAVFGVIGWSGIVADFQGNDLVAAGAVVIFLAIVILVSLFGMGWAAKKSVGYHG